MFSHSNIFMSLPVTRDLMMLCSFYSGYKILQVTVSMWNYLHEGFGTGWETSLNRIRPKNCTKFFCFFSYFFFQQERMSFYDDSNTTHLQCCCGTLHLLISLTIKHAYNNGFMVLWISKLLRTFVFYIILYSFSWTKYVLLIAEVCLPWRKQIVTASILGTSSLSIRPQKFLEWPHLLEILITDEEWLIGAKLGFHF